jgi:hypothetical protein
MDRILQLALVTVVIVNVIIISGGIINANDFENVNLPKGTATDSLAELNSSWVPEMAMAFSPSGFSPRLHTAIMSERFLQPSTLITKRMLNSGP